MRLKLLSLEDGYCRIFRNGGKKVFYPEFFGPLIVGELMDGMWPYREVIG